MVLNPVITAFVRAGASLILMAVQAPAGKHCHHRHVLPARHWILLPGFVKVLQRAKPPVKPRAQAVATVSTRVVVLPAVLLRAPLPHGMTLN